MKWSDLTLKERKKLYDTVRADYPDISYLQLKEHFDSIPEYEDGKETEDSDGNLRYGKYGEYDENALKWMINEQVRLGMTGHSAPSDSLQHIVDKAKLDPANPQHKYDPTIARDRDAKNLLHGLNKTVGTSLTGAQLLTMGGWNLLKTLGVGKGTEYRLWLAKNALAGSQGGLVADIGQLLEDPSVDNALQTMLGFYPLGRKGYLNPQTQVTGLLDSAADLKDLIAPAYEDGKKSDLLTYETKKQFGLIPGTEEYFKRQQKISGKAEIVQPEMYLTPGGYAKDAAHVAEKVKVGDYKGAALDAVSSVVPYAISKAYRKANAAKSSTEIPSIRSKKKTEADYEVEYSDYIRHQRNANKYNQEIDNVINDAINGDEATQKLIKEIDETYGTKYQEAYKAVAKQDAKGRSNYVEWDPLEEAYGKTQMRGINDGRTSNSIDDYTIKLDLDQYVPGTANHEMGHVADGLAGSNQYYDFESGKNYISNPYTRYLADANNTYSTGELLRQGNKKAAASRGYLMNPTEAKSHLLTVKRALMEQGKISKWSDPVTEDMLYEYLSSAQANPMIKRQMDLYKSPDIYLEKLNKLVPMAFGTPVVLDTKRNSKE